MPCPTCGHENRPGAKFCEECAGPLAHRCGGCGAELRPTAKFCDECAAPVAAAAATPSVLRAYIPSEPRAYTPKHLADKILASRSALEGERKQVTVLFADVKGSMELAGQVDPEEWHRLLDRFFQILSSGVHRFEGTVNQYTGDGIMALFGAPIAHEDHAQRACYAALALQRELRAFGNELRLSRGLDFAVRVGLHSGEVVVGRIGDDLRMDYTAQGAVVGLAARLQQVAEAGKVYVSAETARRVEGFFRFEDLGALTVKGVAEPVRVFELTGTGALRTRFDLSRERGLSRFVGRGDELSVLEAALSRAREGRAQLVGIVAEAGVGKSRLCFEFTERCRARGVPLHLARSFADAQQVPLSCALELTRSVLGASERDEAGEARRKVAGAVLLAGEELREVLSIVFDFLGIQEGREVEAEIAPEARERWLAEALRRVLAHESARHPVCIQLEDLHWIDRASDAFLARMIEALAGLPVLILANFRPGVAKPWMQRTQYVQVALSPLPAESTAELLAFLVGSELVGSPLAASILAQACGNPFYVEEIVRELVESGALAGSRGARRLVREAAVSVPLSVQAILAARIDRLAEREKQALQAAAVLGGEFSEALLARVVPEPALDTALSRLVDAELLRVVSLYPDRTFSFEHPLTQEVAYRVQLAEPRSRLHSAAARALLELRGERGGDETWARIAEHHEAAGEKLEAARAWGRAAAASERADALRAFAQWERALPLARESGSAEGGALALRAYVALGGLAMGVGLSEEKAQQLFSEGDALAREAGDDRARVRIVSGRRAFHGGAGDWRSGLECAREAFRLAERTGDHALRVQMMGFVAIAHFQAGELAQSLVSHDEALALVDANPGVSVPPATLEMLYHYRGRVLLEMGRLEEARADLDRADGFGRELDSSRDLHAMLDMRLGNFGAALDRARTLATAAERFGSPFRRVQCRSWLGQALHLCGYAGEAVETLSSALALLTESSASRYYRAGILAQLADALVDAGEPARALERAQESVAEASATQPRFECLVRISLARALLATYGVNGSERAEQELERARVLVEETGARLWWPEILLVRAELARVRGDEASRVRELREAQRVLLEMGAKPRAEAITRELAA